MEVERGKVYLAALGENSENLSGFVLVDQESGLEVMSQKCDSAESGSCIELFHSLLIGLLVKEKTHFLNGLNRSHKNFSKSGAETCVISCEESDAELCQPNPVSQTRGQN